MPVGPRGARESAKLDLSTEDAADEALFNRILWRTVKGPDVPYPECAACVRARD